MRYLMMLRRNDKKEDHDETYFDVGDRRNDCHAENR